MNNTTDKPTVVRWRKCDDIVVSNTGIIKYNDRQLPIYIKDGYEVFGVTKGGKTRMRYVHRMVAFAFIKNPFKKREVNHKNGIKNDNRRSNLEWCTRSENVQHAYRHLGKVGLTKELQFKYKAKKVQAINVLTKEKIVFGSRNEASSTLGISGNHIYRVANGLAKPTRGFKFKFIKKIIT